MSKDVLPDDSRVERPKMVPPGTGPGSHINSPRTAGILKIRVPPIKTATEAVKIAIIAMFFSVDYAFVIRELKNRKKLRRFEGIKDVPSVETVL